MTWRTSSGDLYVGTSPPVGSTSLGILYPRSGTLGGCSAHNALITIYPHESDWSNIESITGDSSWSPANMRPYFEKLERNGYLPSGIIGHGYNGWLGTSLTSLSLVIEDQKLLSCIISAATAVGQSLLGILVDTVVGLGQVLLRDINAPGQPEQKGLYQVPLSIWDSTRNGPRNFILDTANAVNSDGSRKYQLDVRLNTFGDQDKIRAKWGHSKSCRRRLFGRPKPLSSRSQIWNGITYRIRKRQRHTRSHHLSRSFQHPSTAEIKWSRSLPRTRAIQYSCSSRLTRCWDKSPRQIRDHRSRKDRNGFCHYFKMHFFAHNA